MTTDFKTIDVAVGATGLEGALYLPDRPAGLIIFAHGSGSSRFSPRNVFVARNLASAGFACLLFDLLTADEAADRRNVFDISLLGARMRDAIVWAAQRAETRGAPIGLFGASTGAAAALVAAVVSRGGRPDLAGAALAHVTAPTLLLVGGLDDAVIGLNEAALRRLHCRARLDIVPGATHLFEEPGTLELVVDSARRWFEKHLCPERRAAGKGEA